MGAFAEWQPRYAEHGISTFPVVVDETRKKPAVKGYLKIGVPTSSQLAIKFPNHEALGLACKKNRISVLDVDTTDERELADGLSKFGASPFIVRSGSGHFQAWYRNNGEPRRIRPDPAHPIDILGHGYVVAPPSMGARGRYTIIQGTMDDLDRLPAMPASHLPEEGMTITSIRNAATVEITAGTITNAYVEDAAGRRSVPEDIGTFRFFVTVVKPDGGRICMWIGDDYASARAEAGECVAAFDGHIYDLTGRAA